MGTKNETTKATTNTTADEAIELFRKTRDDLTEKEAIFRKVVPLNTNASTTEDALRRRSSEMDVLEARIAACDAAIAGALALQALEVEAGNKTAIASSSAHLLDDLTAIRDEGVRLQEAVIANRRRWAERLQLAEQSLAFLQAERASKDLPPPIAFAHPPIGTGRDVFADMIESCAAFARGDLSLPALDKRKVAAERLRRLRHEDTQHRAELERKRIEEEKEADRVAANREAAARSIEEQARATEQRRLEERERLAAERAETERLAAVHRAREAGGTP